MHYFKTNMVFIFITLSLCFFQNSNAQLFGSRQVISANCDDARFVTACDIDNDGDMDVISASGDDDKIAWYENPGDAHFGEQRIITTSVNHPMILLTADLDGDGDKDLLTGYNKTYNNMPIISSPGYVVWIENQGQGVFNDPVIIDSVAYYPNILSVADLDGDGDFDVLCASRKKITWYPNDGSGNFNNEIDILSSLETSGALQTDDMDKDGDIDIVFSYPFPNGDNLIWMENEGDGSFIYYHVIETATRAPDEIYVTDLDNDKKPDILGIEEYYDKVDQLFWFKNNSWNFKLISTSLEGAKSVYAADLDNDGDKDILTASDEDNKIAWYENDGDGNFGDQQIITSEVNGANSVFATDLDGDGDKDVLSASRLDDTIAWYENLSDPTNVQQIDEEYSITKSFELAQNYPNPFNPTTSITFDLSNNNHVTLKVYDILGKEITELINKPMVAGKHSIIFNGENLSAGIYFYRIQTKDIVETKKMLLCR